ncbi:MAG: NAD(P)-dependent oxidoreductase [Alphaproteobacteria bacterium]|nr:NAD(P)-dependent oxidoreductase [Alphaproteobacteria bacterium]
MARKRVVLTGATGYVAQRMYGPLAERYDLVCLDVKETTRAGETVPDVHIVDLTAPDRDGYREHFRGADAVIHCGFVRVEGQPTGGWNDTSDAKFRSEYINIGMMFNVYKTALEEDVKRVVVCSSNHAADYYERLWYEDKLEMVTPDMPNKSDNFYGWAKGAYEQLGFVFATGNVDGKQLEVCQWRIGGPREDDIDKVKPGDIKNMHRALGSYLSARDQVQQAVKMIETEDIRDENGIPFLVIYGISGNSHRLWSIANAIDKIDYRPEDNSQVKFADKIAKLARAPTIKNPATVPGT